MLGQRMPGIEAGILAGTLACRIVHALRRDPNARDRTVRESVSFHSTMAFSIGVR